MIKEDLHLLSLILSEEVGELVKAINDYKWKNGSIENVYKEVQDVCPIIVSIFNTVRIIKEEKENGDK